MATEDKLYHEQFVCCEVMQSCNAHATGTARASTIFNILLMVVQQNVGYVVENIGRAGDKARCMYLEENAL